MYLEHKDDSATYPGRVQRDEFSHSTTQCHGPIVSATDPTKREWPAIFFFKLLLLKLKGSDIILLA